MDDDGTRVELAARRKRDYPFVDQKVHAPEDRADKKGHTRKVEQALGAAAPWHGERMPDLGRSER